MTTNVVVVLFAVVAIGVLVKNYLASQRVKTSVDVKKGSIFPDIAGVDYKQTSRTLILALNVAASYCIFAPGGSYTLRNVQAEEGCNTSTSCARNSSNNCYCPDVVVGGPGCNGCFVPNGSSGCGSCSSGAAELQ